MWHLDLDLDSIRVAEIQPIKLHDTKIGLFCFRGKWSNSSVFAAILCISYVLRRTGVFPGEGIKSTYEVVEYTINNSENIQRLNLICWKECFVTALQLSKFNTGIGHLFRKQPNLLETCSA